MQNLPGDLWQRLTNTELAKSGFSLKTFSEFLVELIHQLLYEFLSKYITSFVLYGLDIDWANCGRKTENIIDATIWVVITIQRYIPYFFLIENNTIIKISRSRYIVTQNHINLLRLLKVVDKLVANKKIHAIYITIFFLWLWLKNKTIHEAIKYIVINSGNIFSQIKFGTIFSQYMFIKKYIK